MNGVVEYAGVSGNPTQTGSPLAVKLSPRAGFAYSLNQKTVLHGGYGIYLLGALVLQLPEYARLLADTSIISSTNGNVTPAGLLANPYPNGLIELTGNTLGGLSKIGQAFTVFSPASGSAGCVQEYSFELQRPAPAGIVLTTGFIGSHSLHLNDSGQNINQLNPSCLPLSSATLTKSVANPFYGISNVGVGSLANKTVSDEQLLLPFPRYTSVAE